MFIAAIALSPAHGDETITLTLTKPVVEQQEEAPTPNPQPNRAGARMGRTSLPSRGGSSRRSDAKETVVGRLGVLQKNSAIRIGKGSGRTLCQAQAGTYVALTAEAPHHYGVLMADRSMGWIAKRDVNVLQYEVVGNKDYNSGPQYASNPALSGNQNQLLQVAYKCMGIPYKYGGTSNNGIDCSSFVQQCFGALGYRLPRTAAEQFNVGMPVTDVLQPADRLYFAKNGGRISHTGIYIGNGYFIHASSSNRGVVVSNLREAMYTRMYAGARR
jgi:cell wall-associated NlpC family hydrolase